MREAHEDLIKEIQQNVRDTFNMLHGDLFTLFLRVKI